jgi:O-antigen ligase
MTALTIYAVIATLSLLVGMPTLALMFRFSFRFAWIALLVMYLYNTITSLRRLRIIMAVVSISLGLYLAISVLIFLLSPTLYASLAPANRSLFDSRLYPLGSSIDIGPASQAILALLPLQFALYRQSSRAHRVAIIATVTAWFVAAFLMQSRSLLVAAAILALAYLGYSFAVQVGRARHRVVTIIVLLAVLAGPVVNSQYASRFNFSPGTSASERYGLRVDYWRGALSLFLHHPILGVGVGQFGYEIDRGALPEVSAAFETRSKVTVHAGDEAHNMYLNTLAETGVLGLMAFAAILFGVARSAIRELRATRRTSPSEERIVLFYLVLGVAGFLIFGFTNSGERSPLLFLLLAMVSAATRLCRRARRGSEQSNRVPMTAPTLTAAPR